MRNMFSAANEPENTWSRTFSIELRRQTLSLASERGHQIKGCESAGFLR